MKRKRVSRDELLKHMYGLMSKEQRRKVIKALIKIFIGILLIIAGYFLPHP